MARAGDRGRYADPARPQHRQDVRRRARDIVDRLHGAHRTWFERLRARLGEVTQQVDYAQALAAELATDGVAQQSLFGDAAPRLRAAALVRVFSPGLAELIARASPPSSVTRSSTASPGSSGSAPWPGRGSRSTPPPIAISKRGS
ncbi:MAG TPA: hypothetical protein VH165_17570 [Kofleriaceae bacterium]|nr:hypothetical protein [Kofleriaceae bacterium]